MKDKTAERNVIDQVNAIEICGKVVDVIDAFSVDDYSHPDRDPREYLEAKCIAAVEIHKLYESLLAQCKADHTQQIRREVIGEIGPYIQQLFDDYDQYQPSVEYWWRQFKQKWGVK